MSDEICKFAYKLNLIHKFDEGNSLQELKEYKHKRTGKPGNPPQSFVCVSSYPELVEDIMANKIR